MRGLRREKDAILSKESHHIFIAVYYLVFFYYNCCWGEEEEEKKRGRTIYEPFSLPSCLLFSSSSSYFFTDLLWKASTCLHGSSSFSVLEMCEYGYIYFRLDFFVYRKHIFVRRDRMGWDCEIGCWSARCLRPSFAILPTRWRWQMWRLWNRKPIIRNDCRRRGEGYSFLNLRKKEGEREAAITMLLIRVLVSDGFFFYIIVLPPGRLLAFSLSHSWFISRFQDAAGHPKWMDEWGLEGARFHIGSRKRRQVVVGDCGEREREDSPLKGHIKRGIRYRKRGEKKRR